MSIKTSSGDMNPILKANIDGQSYVGVALLRTGTLHLSDGSTGAEQQQLPPPLIDCTRERSYDTP